jgi:hypothetical protein
MIKDEWEENFQKWRKIKQTKKEQDEVEKTEEKTVKAKEENETPTERTESGGTEHTGMRKIVWLIPLVIFGYLVYANFLASQEFNYFYDIGSEGENYLTPGERVSEIVNEGDLNYRNLTGHLVYLDVPIPRGAEKVYVEARIKTNVPEDGKISLGARDQEEWHYLYHLIYNPGLDLSGFERIGNVYRVGDNLSALDLEQLRGKTGVVIATDMPTWREPTKILDYKKTETVIDTTLRGGHVFYVYASGDLNVEIKKQDINWYEGSDELYVSLYDSEGNLVTGTTIADDGETKVNKKKAEVQSGVLNAADLSEGVYKLEFNDFDGLIREIKINTNKIVAEKLFLAGNELYGVETEPSEIYFSSSRDKQLKLVTYHASGIQEVDYVSGEANGTFDFYREDAPLEMDVGLGNYELTFPKNDVIVEGEYFAFSREGYFVPFKQKIVPLSSGLDWIKKNADYVVTDYTRPVEDDGWQIVNSEFDVGEEKLHVQNNKLSFVFSVPHLSQEEFANYTIPVDWIKVTVYKPGVFG